MSSATNLTTFNAQTYDDLHTLLTMINDRLNEEGLE